MTDRFTVRYNPLVHNGNPQDGTPSMGAIDAGTIQVLDATSRMAVEIQIDNIDQAQGNDAAAQLQTRLNDDWGYSRAESVYMMVSGQQPEVTQVNPQHIVEIATEIVHDTGPQAVVTGAAEIDTSNRSIYRPLEAGSTARVGVAADAGEPIWNSTYRIWSNEASPTGEAGIEFIDTNTGVRMNIPVSQLSQEEATVVAGAIKSSVSLGQAFETAIHAHIASPNYEAPGMHNEVEMQSTEGIQRAAQSLIDAADRDGVKGTVARPTVREFIPG